MCLSIYYPPPRTGVENPDSSIGIYAPDPEAYTVYRQLFTPIIRDYHGLKEGALISHPAKDWGRVDDIGAFKGDQIVSTRIRIARNIVGIVTGECFRKR